MSAWLVWTIVAAVCAGAEAVTLTLVLGFVSMAAVAALIVAVAGGPVPLQFGAFIAGSIGLRRRGPADREVTSAYTG